MYFIFPLQGFLNSLAYFRPRIARFLSKYVKECRSRRNRKRRSEETSKASSEKSPVADLVEVNEALYEAASSLKLRNAICETPLATPTLEASNEVVAIEIDDVLVSEEASWMPKLASFEEDTEEASNLAGEIHLEDEMVIRDDQR
mmetsp:Transcript_9266/g.15409  ORF Transcript_9266/g.15409 Transcript_9266/m.15409 type:complete len:145 (+) Transcript_9266:560-994(+)